MSRKSELKKEIAACQEEIEKLEKKLTRPQSSLLSSFFSHSEPNAQDAEFFNLYTKLIELERAKMQELQDELNNL